MGSSPITCSSVTHWASMPRGMQFPQAKKMAGTVRPLERGFEYLYDGFSPNERFLRVLPTGYLQRQYCSGVQNFSDVPGKPARSLSCRCRQGGGEAFVETASLGQPVHLLRRAPVMAEGVP